MIGIKAIASYVPPGRIDNRARLSEFDVDEDFLAGKIGIEAVSRRAEDEDTAALCEKAFAQLQAEIGLEPGAVDCAVVCT